MVTPSHRHPFAGTRARAKIRRSSGSGWSEIERDSGTCPSEGCSTRRGGGGLLEHAEVHHAAAEAEERADHEPTAAGEPDEREEDRDQAPVLFLLLRDHPTAKDDDEAREGP